MMLNQCFKANWTGRIDDPVNRKSFRYHQVVELIDDIASSSLSNTCVLLGFECEEGVRRNNGRLGAALAPNALRGELSKLPWKFSESNRFVDIGNVSCSDNNLEFAQQELGQTVSTILQKEGIPIILGGGHETAFGHYLGVRNAIGEKASLGIINVDAHFDLRAYNTASSSGTMFKQILEKDTNTAYFVAGIQQYGNTQELFDTAHRLNVQYLLEEDIEHDKIECLIDSLEAFIKKHDHIMLTLCTDVLNAAFAPGVSAPSPFGLKPATVRSIIHNVTSHDNTCSFDISEINPVVDENNRTVKLGAYLVNEAIAGFIGKG